MIEVDVEGSDLAREMLDSLSVLVTFEAQELDSLGHLVNPILDLSDELQDGEEGCLSFPELRYNTPRAMRAVAKGFNMYGDPVLVEGSEFLARALQHETDHLDGILFIEKLSDEDRKAAMKEIRESDWFGLADSAGRAPIIKESPHLTTFLGQ